MTVKQPRLMSPEGDLAQLECMIKKSGGPVSRGIARYKRMRVFEVLLSSGLWNGNTRSRGRTREAPRESMGRGCLSGMTSLGKCQGICIGFVGGTFFYPRSSQRASRIKSEVEKDAGCCVDDTSGQVTGCVFGCWL